MGILQLSTDQERALERLLAWVKKPNSASLTLGGYAGTGKTTLISLMRKALDGENDELRVAFAAFTGKASQVLRTQLESEEALFPNDTCGTIHSLLYKPEVNSEGKITNWRRSKQVDADLIVIDEASMVTDTLWMDLVACGKPIIALGDHGQLPPIGGHFDLMRKPDITLEHIHRQAEGNPIIALAHGVRLNGRIEPGDYSASVRKFSHTTHEPHAIDDVIEHLLGNYHDDMLVLCGRNKTRVQLNRAIRQKMGRESDEPEIGEKVVCLRNNYDQFYAPIYNGMTGFIDQIQPEGEHWYDASIRFPEEERAFEGRITRHQFNQPALVEDVKGLSFKQIGDRYDYGYALTVHKAQGSQAKTVVLFEERFIKSDDDQWRRWLYTAVTRARENLYIIGPD